MCLSTHLHASVCRHVDIAWALSQTKHESCLFAVSEQATPMFGLPWHPGTCRLHACRPVYVYVYVCWLGFLDLDVYSKFIRVVKDRLALEHNLGFVFDGWPCYFSWWLRNCKICLDLRPLCLLRDVTRSGKLWSCPMWMNKALHKRYIYVMLI